MQCTPTNCARLDFVWVRGKTPACLSKSLARLPFQGERSYHACAVRFMLQTRLITWADLGLGIRGSGRLSQEVFRAPLDAMEAKLPQALRKAAVNQWLGSLMIPPSSIRSSLSRTRMHQCPSWARGSPRRRRAAGTYFADNAGSLSRATGPCFRQSLILSSR